MNEDEVIRAVLGGEVDRYAEIVRQYQTLVANLCYKMGGAEVEVDEMTQQVFVELYQALPRFKFQSKLSTFVYRIALNVVSKELKRRRRLDYRNSEAEMPEVADDLPDAEQQMMEREQRTELRRALGTLRAEQRTALVLYTFHDFSYNDIADVMQCSVAKVESLIFRARKNLQKILTR